MSERFAQPNERDPDWSQPECGAWQAVFWITIGALIGVMVGLTAWVLWGAK